MFDILINNYAKENNDSDKISSFINEYVKKFGAFTPKNDFNSHLNIVAAHINSINNVQNIEYFTEFVNNFIEMGSKLRRKYATELRNILKHYEQLLKNMLRKNLNFTRISYTDIVIC